MGPFWALREPARLNQRAARSTLKCMHNNLFLCYVVLSLLVLGGLGDRSNVC